VYQIQEFSSDTIFESKLVEQYTNNAPVPVALLQLMIALFSVACYLPIKWWSYITKYSMILSMAISIYWIVCFMILAMLIRWFVMGRLVQAHIPILSSGMILISGCCCFWWGYDPLVMICITLAISMVVALSFSLRIWMKRCMMLEKAMRLVARLGICTVACRMGVVSNRSLPSSTMNKEKLAVGLKSLLAAREADEKRVIQTQLTTKSIWIQRQCSLILSRIVWWRIGFRHFPIGDGGLDRLWNEYWIIPHPAPC
jgi:hypothetical protein